MTKLRKPPLVMLDRCVGSAGDLIGVWVGRLVVKASCHTAETGVILHAVAILFPLLMMTCKGAVAIIPTCTERLL